MQYGSRLGTGGANVWSVATEDRFRDNKDVNKRLAQPFAVLAPDAGAIGVVKRLAKRLAARGMADQTV